ncbi:hypothetical protein [Adhaeretor mobilis]|uniref:PEP-CTERM protein-sorting domain-containing protein n=1 Tax=Adhaeretor mobilis TaxID=1930276 RepID=A0A517MPM1_9BACT|nr:hypothetical protein [Adhaeretor mobilis]QDS96830.1 hypothetical protein HG15A2_00880 [Adhaeretor mobilis]
MFSRALLFLLLVVALAIHPSAAHGAFEIAIHGDGSGGTPDVGTVGFAYLQTQTGTVSGMLEETGSGDGNGYHFAHTTAEVVGGSSFNAFTNLYGYAENERAGTFVPFGKASIAALWQDAVTLTGSSALPAAIRLHFLIEGTASATQIAQPQAGTLNSFIARATSDPTDFEGTLDTTHFVEAPLDTNFFGNTMVSYIVNTDPIPSEPTTQNWDTLSTGGSGAFSGTFSLDVELDETPGTYDWAVLFSAYARTRGGTATTDVNNISLVAVTDDSDDPLDGFTVEFDSGRTISPPAGPGDIDADGDVDGGDFLLWQRTDGSPSGLMEIQSNYGNGGSATATFAVVPEPANLVYLALLTTGLLGIVRRRS